MLARLLLIAMLLALSEHAVLAGDDGSCLSASAHRDRAIALYRQGDLSSATVQLQEAVRSCPSQPFYQFMLANAYYRAGNLRGSASSYESFVELRPNHFEANMSLGFALFELGATSEATGRWSTAAAIEPDSPFARAALAVGLYSTGDANGAVVQFQRATILDARYRRPEALAVDIRWKPPVRAILGEVDRLSELEAGR